MKLVSLCCAVVVLFGSPLAAQIAGSSGRDDLLIADAGGAKATVVVAPGAGTWEKQAATDLVKYWPCPDLVDR